MIFVSDAVSIFPVFSSWSAESVSNTKCRFIGLQNVNAIEVARQGYRDGTREAVE
jgi:hypothetical protein